MSRVGKSPIKITGGAKVEITEASNIYGGQTVVVNGSKGTLTVELRPEVSAKVEGEVLNLALVDNGAGNYHGLYRTLLQNAVIGTTQGYTKDLEIIGIGYRAEVSGQVLKLSIGFTHVIDFKLPDGIKAEVHDAVNVKISGCDKQMVGEVAAQIRELRKPEPYKGKGIRYKGELVKRKAGKAAA